jgi:hypothetical protein
MALTECWLCGRFRAYRMRVAHFLSITTTKTGDFAVSSSRMRLLVAMVMRHISSIALRWLRLFFLRAACMN